MCVCVCVCVCLCMYIHVCVCVAVCVCTCMRESSKCSSCIRTQVCCGPQSPGIVSEPGVVQFPDCISPCGNGSKARMSSYICKAANPLLSSLFLSCHFILLVVVPLSWLGIALISGVAAHISVACTYYEIELNI